MRVWAVAVGVVVACGAADHGSTALPHPNPPTAVLAAWKDFPANAKPRPIIAFGDTVEQIQKSGFPTNERKIAWLCNEFVFAPGVKPSDSVTRKATAGGSTYPGISSARAYAELMSARSSSGSSSQCASLPPFVITAVRWGQAGFPTDRGTMTMSAWLFDVPEVGAYIGHAAIDPSAFWGGGLTTEGRGARISADGLTLKIPVSNPGSGPCDSRYTASTAESATAVAVAVMAIPNSSPGQQVICPAVLRIGFISVALKSPLGGRVLLDESGKVGGVCPENGEC